MTAIKLMHHALSTVEATLALPAMPNTLSIKTVTLTFQPPTPNRPALVYATATVKLYTVVDSINSTDKF